MSRNNNEYLDSVTDDCGNETLVNQIITIEGAPVPDPYCNCLTINCEGDDAIFTITGVEDVSYDTGFGSNTITLVGGEAYCDGSFGNYRYHCNANKYFGWLV